MVQVRTILCAVDFSEASRTAAAYARTLAAKLGARVVCLFAAPTFAEYDDRRLPAGSSEKLAEEIATGAEQVMDVFVRENFPGLEVGTRIVRGDPAAAIIDAAAEERADLIVMGTHGRRGLERVLFGSVAEKVVKAADCPVLTVRPEW